MLPEGVLDELRKLDAILLGAIGHPDVKPGILEKGILLRLRFELDQYINLRPVRLYPGVETPIKDKGPKEIDYVVVRENSGDIYTGVGGILNEGHARRSGDPGQPSTPASRSTAACARRSNTRASTARRHAAWAKRTRWRWSARPTC